MKLVQNSPALTLVLLCLVGLPAFGDEASVPRAPNSEGKTYLLVARRPTIGSPSRQQKIGTAAVRRIAEAAGVSGIIVDQGPDTVVQREQSDAESPHKKAGSELFKRRLERLSRIATPQDTVIIYTHSHGIKNRGQGSQSLGGLVIDQPVDSSYRGILSWDEYAELILDVPAKNVIVLTMSCFSGELVNSLNSPPRKARWENRRQEEGRSLIVLTAQNDLLTSSPIVKESEIINPFTFTVSKVFAGAADGFVLTNGSPDDTNDKDGKLTVGEMVDYVLHTTENVTSEHPRFRNTAKPQVTGCFNREDVLSFVYAEADKVAKSTLKEDDVVPATASDGISQFMVATSFLTNDADGDGRITREEAEPAVADAYDVFDQNEDGLVDQNEFKAVAPRYIKSMSSARNAESQPAPSSRFISQLFSRNDSNGDGKITREEARPVVINAYDQFDQNSDGVVDQDEFKAVAPRFIRTSNSAPSARSQPATPTRQISQLFSRNDANGDGKISRDEAKTVVARAFDEFDRNNDGSINQDEFEATINSRAIRNRSGQLRP